VTPKLGAHKALARPSGQRPVRLTWRDADTVQLLHHLYMRRAVVRNRDEPQHVGVELNARSLGRQSERL
jgi:hypothetical protein